MKSGRPALRLPDLAARLFQGLSLEVIPEEQCTLLLGELLHRPPHPALQLLQLQPLVRGQRIVRDLHPLGCIEAGGEDHRQPGHGVGDVPYIIVGGAPSVASALLPVGQISQVAGGALGQVRVSRVLSPENAHLPETIENGPLDAVVRKSEKICPDFWIESVGGFQQAHLPVGDQLLQLQRRAELLAHLSGQGPDVGPVLLENNLSVLAKAHGLDAYPFAHSRSSSCETLGSSSSASVIRPVSAVDLVRNFRRKISSTKRSVASRLLESIPCRSC